MARDIPETSISVEAVVMPDRGIHFLSLEHMPTEAPAQEASLINGGWGVGHGAAWAGWECWVALAHKIIETDIRRKIMIEMEAGRG